MRASPAFQITVSRFGLWRAALAALWAAAFAVGVAWFLARDQLTPVLLDVIAAVLGLAMLVVAATLWRCPAMSLRWDTRRWNLGPAATAGDEPWQGTAAVALDLGAWMLLRFEHDSAKLRRRVTWLAIQRRGLEAQWHGLRCALYFARPAPSHDAGPNSAISPESQE